MSYRSERMICFHRAALSGCMAERNIKFNDPYIPQDATLNDTVISNCPSKKVAVITRHLLTGEATHALILEKEHYDRL